MTRYGMIIDLDKCVGCGACALGCKTENNTGDRAAGQTFNWADFLVTEEGRFPHAVATTLPVLCNHCSNAACVEACPVEPKAMYKTADGITMHNDERCIGCQSCQEACPYSALDVDEEGVQYSIISFNEDGIGNFHRFESTAAAIAGGTATGAELTRRVGAKPAHRTDYRHPDYEPVRRPDVTEKCIFCAHRMAEEKLPRCVVVCPAEARIFGDLDDPASEAARLLEQNKSFRLKEEAGTRPNVHYIGSYATKKNG